MFAIQKAYCQGGLARSQWSHNIIAGLVVGVVALPLAMAFAIASGVTPQAGIYTAIIAGIFVSIFGGSQVQIAGPTGAFSGKLWFRRITDCHHDGRYYADSYEYG